MTYQVSYLIDIEHKFSFMNVSYQGNSQAPIGYWPLEFSNLENVKTMNHKWIVRGLNEITCRIGAVFSVPLTFLDITITAVVGTVLHCLNKFWEDGESLGKVLVCLSNRIYANEAILAIAMVRFFVGSRAFVLEQKMDDYISARMKSDEVISV